MDKATELTTEFDGFVAGVLTVGDSVTLSVWVNALRAAGALELIGGTCHRYTQHPTILRQCDECDDEYSCVNITHSQISIQ